MAALDLDARLEAALQRELGPARVMHCRSVAALAEILCRRNGLDPMAGRIAGLAHDLCKEMPLARQEALATIYSSLSGRDIPKDGVIGRAALHGPAAAGLLASEFGLDDADILEAVALHTLGAEDMGDLARIIYAADKLEPGRGHVDPKFRADCLELPPGALFSAVLADTVGWLRSMGQPVAAESLELHERIAAREIDA